MKSIIIMLIYTGTFMTMFFLLSLIGLLWNDSYHAVISDHGWFMAYTILFGWWLSLFPTVEYYKHNQEYFEEYL